MFRKEDFDETIFEECNIRWDEIIHKRYKVSKMGDYRDNHLFCIPEKTYHGILPGSKDFRSSMSFLRPYPGGNESASLRF